MENIAMNSVNKKQNENNKHDKLPVNFFITYNNVYAI